MNMQMTVTLGDILTIASFAVAGVAVYVRLSDRLTALEIKLDPVWRWFLAVDEDRERTR
jgi:hypothetical protein